MRLNILAIGRLRAGPEKDLCADYMNRLDVLGRGMGISVAPLLEFEEKKKLEGAALKAREGELLISALPRGATLVALDERGRQEGSEAFAARIAAWRDGGVSDIAFVIGGADGHSPALRERADHLLAFGPMTWPHFMVRAMLAEQLYRAVTIMSGHPYHRV